MMKKTRPWLLALVCYGAALLVYLGGCTARLTIDSARASGGALAPRELTYQDITNEGFVPREGEPGLYVSTQEDAKLFYEPGAPFYATGFVFKGTPRNKPGGEMVLYYKTDPAAGYEVNRRVWAKQRPDGAWTFDLGGRRYAGLRLDPDNMGGVLWEVEGFWLEGKQPAWAYYRPDAQTVFLLLFAPGMLAAALHEGDTLRRLWSIRQRVRAADA